ncbi:platelet-activating factor acetyltransferase [Aureococcus anophagefferens]|nr:platelet-activating factor acetyltransferase [Aureococcus anophagefferens]
MVDAATVAQWGYDTGNVLGVSDAFLASDPALVATIVEKFAQATYDYTNNQLSGLWDAGADYMAYVDDFVYLTDVTGATPHWVDGVPNDDLHTSTTRASWARWARSPWASKGMRERVEIEEQIADDSEKCAPLTHTTVSGSAVFASGNTGTSAYSSNATCVWALESDEGCLELSVDFLAAEAPNDVLEAYDHAGFLVARWTGRHGASIPTLKFCGDYDASDDFQRAVAGELAGLVSTPTFSAATVRGVGLYLRWATDAYSEHAIGKFDAVGFSVTATAVGPSDLCGCGSHGESLAGVYGTASCACVCDAGWSGAACDEPRCNGVVVANPDGEFSGTLRATAPGEQTYAAWSTCGWRIQLPAAYSHVDLAFTSLALEDGFDFVRVYKAGIPEGYAAGSTRTFDDYEYSATGASGPSRLLVKGSVFVAFESDGLVGSAVDGDGLAADGGFEIGWSLVDIDVSFVADESDCNNAVDCKNGGTCAWVFGSGNELSTTETRCESLGAASGCFRDDWACECAPGYYGENCDFDHCVGEIVDVGYDLVTTSASGGYASPRYAGLVLSGAGADYPPSTTCLWSFPVMPHGAFSAAGVRLRFDAFDLEGEDATYALASTTDRVEIWLQDGSAPRDVAPEDLVAESVELGSATLLATISADDFAVGLYDVGAAFDLEFPGYAADAANPVRVAVKFASDKNNPAPYSGFALRYAPLWGEGDGTFADYCDDDWACGDGYACSGMVCAPPSSSSGGAAVDVGLILLVVAIIVAALGAVFFYYRRQVVKSLDSLKGNLASLEAELQDFKDSVVGFKVAVQDYVPEAVSVDVAGDDANAKYEAEAGGAVVAAVAGAPAAARWYWREEQARLGSHDPAKVKSPHWVAYDDGVAAALERAYGDAGASKVVATGGPYKVDVATMKQVNERTNYERDVLRDVHPAAPGANTDRRPEELLGEDALLLRAGSVLQVSKTRPDGWAYGSVVLHGGDEAADRAYVQDGVSLSTGWFPLECTDVPSVEQLSKLQDALGGSGGLKPPDSWEEVKDPLVAQYFPLRDGEEKANVVKNFLSTLDASRFTIVAVERIQNVGAWQSFAVKRESVLEKIVQQGFNRSFCGKNATFYGKGVYFARDASYSTNKTYAVPDQNGVQHMFYVRVTVGEYCKGVKDALTPDVREGLNLYDTTVNNVADPSIFVTYHDAQAYPEYLIKFRQEGVEHMRGAYSQSAPQQPPRQQAAPPAAGARRMMIQVPPNVAPGERMQVRVNATGQMLVVKVPPGVAPGQTITVAY